MGRWTALAVFCFFLVDFFVEFFDFFADFVAIFGFGVKVEIALIGLHGWLFLTFFLLDFS